MTKYEIYKLLYSTETSRIERTVSTGDMDNVHLVMICQTHGRMDISS